MRAKDVSRLSAIRLLMAAIKQREVDERIELSDDQVIAAIEKMLKQRRDSISSSNPPDGRIWLTPRSSRCRCCRAICRSP